MVYRKMTQTEKASYAKEKKDELIKDVLNIAENYRVNSDDMIQFLAFSSRFYKYSSRNLALIHKQNPYAQFIASYSDFKEMGYKPLSPGMKILVPVKLKYFRQGEEGIFKPLKEASQEVKKLIKEGSDEVSLRTIESFSIGTVFDIGQTDCPNEALPKILNKGERNLVSSVHISALRDYCQLKNIKINEPVFLGSVTLNGYADVINDEITLNERLEDNLKLDVLTHELSHIEITRANNFSKEIQKTECQREFEADALSYMLLNKFGQHPTEHRQRHLKMNYDEFIKEQDNLDENERFPVFDMLQKVRNIYTTMAPAIDSFADKYKGLNLDIQMLEESNYKGRFSVKIYQNEINDYIINQIDDIKVPLIPEVMPIQTVTKEFNKLETILQKSAEEDLKLSYMIVDQNSEETVFSGQHEFGEGINFIDQLNKQLLIYGTLMEKDDQEGYEELKNTVNLMKEDIYKGLLFELNEEYKDSDQGRREEITQEVLGLNRSKERLSKLKTESYSVDEKNKQKYFQREFEKE